MEFFLLDFFLAHPALGYALIFLGMLVEGDLVLFTAAFLAELGIFGIVPVILISAIGMIGGDIGWYALGTCHNKLPLRLQRLIEKIGAPFDRMLRRHLLHTLLITKFTYGAHRLVLLRAGGDRLGLSRFFQSDAVATAVWITVIVSLGYFGGFALSQAKEYLRFAEAGLLLCLIALFTAEKVAKKFSSGNSRAPSEKVDESNNASHERP